MMDAQRADNVGFWVGVGVMALIAGALYVAHRVLMHRFGDSWATLIVYVPAFCAVFVIAPVQWRVSYFLRRRYCREHGHAPRQLLGCEPGSMICERCSALLPGQAATPASRTDRSEEHTSELQSLMRISYAVFCLTKKNTTGLTATKS